LQEIQHPAIFQVVEIIEDPMQYCIVTQIIKGGAIVKRLLKEGHMNEEQAKVIVKQILSCLLYLHSKNIVHRDIKLENILFSSTDSSNLKVRLIDFGFSTKYERM
jgi:calcium-dependent protein kinase